MYFSKDLTGQNWDPGDSGITPEVVSLSLPLWFLVNSSVHFATYFSPDFGSCRTSNVDFDILCMFSTDRLQKYSRTSNCTLFNSPQGFWDPYASTRTVFDGHSHWSQDDVAHYLFLSVLAQPGQLWTKRSHREFIILDYVKFPIKRGVLQVPVYRMPHVFKRRGLVNSPSCFRAFM